MAEVLILLVLSFDREWLELLAVAAALSAVEQVVVEFDVVMAAQLRRFLNRPGDFQRAACIERRRNPKAAEENLADSRRFLSSWCDTGAWDDERIGGLWRIITSLGVAGSYRTSWDDDVAVSLASYEQDFGMAVGFGGFDNIL